MSRVYSVQMIESHAGAYGEYEPDPGYVAVVRCVIVFNSSGIAPATAHLVLEPSAVTIFQWVLGSTNQGGGSDVIYQDMRAVFHAGEKLVTANDGTIDMLVSGYMLSLP
jgi:hypothetical protein